MPPVTQSWITQRPSSAPYFPQSSLRYFPQTRSPETIPTTTEYLNIEPRIATESFDCGIPDFSPPKFSGLVINGKVAVRGQFPW